MTRTRCIQSLLATVVLLATARGAGAQLELLEKLRKTTPDQRAELQTELMKTKLGLSAGEEGRVGALNLEYARKLQPVLESDAGPLSIRSQMRSANDEKEAELKTMLTPVQLERYLAAKDEIRDEFEKRILAAP